MTRDLSPRKKVVLITGSTRGIGKETALALAALGATTVIVGRDAQRTAQVAAEIQNQTGSQRIDYLVTDLSSLAQTRNLAQEFMRRYDRLHVLINNAGAIFMKREESVEGFEKTLALNHLSPFLLTNLLLDVLRASAPARIINVSSAAHRMARVRFDDLQYQRGYRGWIAYAQSKLANIYFTRGLEGWMDGRGVSANALHPGFVATHFGRSNGGVFAPFFALSQVLAVSPQEGAQTSIYLAASPEVEGVSGKYFHRCRAVAPSPAAGDLSAARRLWDISLELTAPF
mgnify:CR=1 FL=1